MRVIESGEGIERALDALLSRRLAVLCGAGLSMAPPSNLPNAAAIAAEAKAKYDATYGTTRNPLPSGIDDQAEFFFQRGELDRVYLRNLIDPNAFASIPNGGHRAIADMLLTGGMDCAVTTNVDSLIEAAGNALYGQIGTALTRSTIITLPTGVPPLLKLHGCWTINRAETIWARGQLLTEPIRTRISDNREWLRLRLVDKDILIVGYWSDWDYLNQVLSQCLAEVDAARVIVINPDAPDALEAKAPDLYQLGTRATSEFLYVRESGSDFLASLRTAFSQTFVRRVLTLGATAYENEGLPVIAGWREPPHADADDLWAMRRDLAGSRPNHPASDLVPPDEPLLGLTIISLRAQGAVAEGPYWLLNGQRIRILRAPNQMLHQVQEAYASETPQAIAADITIAVGAENRSLPGNIARTGTPATIARGTPSRWLTRQDAIEEFAL